MEKTTHTKGNVIVEDIQIGDIHYEYELGYCIKTEVISKPVMKDEMWQWQSKNLKSGGIVDYGINPNYTHYGPNLYDYEAYLGCPEI